MADVGKNDYSTLVPTTHFRFAVDHQLDMNPVLQQAFRRPYGGPLIWQAVPLVLVTNKEHPATPLAAAATATPAPGEPQKIAL
jgi:hypothetical protein